MALTYFNEGTVTDQNETGNPYDYIWFGWSYQSTWENGLGGGVDPVYNTRWAGSTQSGIDGNRRWGLDSEDTELTENRVSMDTYLDAVEQYNQYYSDHQFKTKFFFSNGVVDNNEGTELGFQRELKNQHIRDYVSNNGNNDTYFLDYADILVYNSEGELHTVNWDDNGTPRPHQQIHPDNKMDYDENFNIIDPGSDEIDDHIGEVGALRLAKAMCWLLARASGWDGNTTSVSVSSITLSSAGNITELESGSTLQFSALVLPENATNKELDWSVVPGTGTATISVQGLLSAGTPGTVTVVATARDGSHISGSFLLSIASLDKKVTSIIISSEGGVSEVEEGEQLKLTATVYPTDASNSSVFWHVTKPANSAGMGTITNDGMFFALTEGVVDVIAIAQDSSGVNDVFTLTILGPTATGEIMDRVVTLYPNPGGGLFYLNVGGLEIDMIQVIDANGMMVLEFAPVPRTPIIEMDLSNQQVGIYLIKVKASDQFIFRKAIITR